MIQKSTRSSTCTVMKTECPIRRRQPFGKAHRLLKYSRYPIGLWHRLRTRRESFHALHGHSFAVFLRFQHAERNGRFPGLHSGSRRFPARILPCHPAKLFSQTIDTERPRQQPTVSAAAFSRGGNGHVVIKRQNRSYTFDNIWPKSKHALSQHRPSHSRGSCRAVQVRSCRNCAATPSLNQVK